MELFPSGPRFNPNLIRKPAPPQENLSNPVDITENVEKFSKIISNYGEMYNKTKDYVENHIDAVEITQNAGKIAAAITSEEGKMIPNEAMWDEKIENFVKKYQSDYVDREVLFKSFVRDLENSYSSGVTALDVLQTVGEKTLALETLTMVFTSIGQKLAKSAGSKDKKSSDIIDKMLGYSSLTVPWVKVGLICHQSFIQSQKIEFCKSELKNFQFRLETEILSPDERIQLESQVLLLQRQISAFDAEKSTMINDALRHGFNGAMLAVDKTHQVLSDASKKSIIAESSSMLHAAALGMEGAVVAGSVLSLGLKLYNVLQSSDKLVTLKQNMTSLHEEHQKENEPFKAIMLKAKLDRLDVLERDISIALTQNVLESVVSGMAICATVETLLVAAGVTLGATATLAFNATGIGAVVLGTGITVGSLAYATYANRHTIQHGLETFDILPRKLYLEHQLKNEFEIYDKAKKTFDESSKKLEMLQLVIPAAWDTKLAIDKRHDETSLKQQKEVSQVYLGFTAELNESIKNATEASLTMAACLPKFKQLRREYQLLAKRQEAEDAKLVLNSLAVRFSKYDIKTLHVVQSMVKEALATPKGARQIRDFMIAHKYTPIEPLTSDQILDFITDGEQVLSEVI